SACLAVAQVAGTVGCTAQYVDFSWRGSMPRATARALQHLGALIFGDDALEVEQELIFGSVGLRRLGEYRLRAMAGELFDEQHLVGIFAAQPIRREYQDCLNLAFRSQV